ncbi:MAG: hypothetical protein K5755_05210 [Clostridiales bacterium]|nr:hypothetical protein [Clostridia bacterium]MCR4564013.1 hypothetical protein [Clostridiales bacterium]
MSRLKVNLTRAFFLIISVLFLGIGIYNEEFTAVLEKAVRICLECIGIA